MSKSFYSPTLVGGVTFSCYHSIYFVVVVVVVVVLYIGRIICFGP